MTESSLDRAGPEAGNVRLRRSLKAAKVPAVAAAWALCVVLMYELLVAVNYPLRDADSSLYQAIAASLEARPWVEWLAPMWPPGRHKSGLFAEHLPFFFWPTAALGRLGFARAALLANLIYFLGCLYLLFLIARPLIRTEGAWLAVALYSISPLGIQYLVRANHENAWAIGFLGALYCMRNPSRPRIAAVGFVLCAAFAFLIKGVLALALFPALGLWWWWSSRRGRDLLAFAAALGAVALISLGYEWVYRRLTGESFFANYLGAQMSYVYRDEGDWLRKLLNPAYYAANIVYFALPSSVLAIYATYRTRRLGQRPTEAQGLAYVCTGSHFALALSFARRAARYIFPAYPLIHLPAAQLICDSSPRLGQWLQRNETYLPYAMMLIISLVLVGRVLVALNFYHFVRPF